MSSPYVGEVRPWACTFAPLGWAFCQGQILPIQQNTALFSLFGTIYGGNGTSTFALPDLRSRVPMKFGTSPSGSYAIGEQGGVELVQLNAAQMPVHNHTFSGTNASSTREKPAASGSSLGTAGGNYYAANTGTLTPINVGTVSLYTGGNQSHTNVQPYQAINWCVALRGIYPPRN
jgi:microcystin-dependent protein